MKKSFEVTSTKHKMRFLVLLLENCIQKNSGFCHASSNPRRRRWTRLWEYCRYFFLFRIRSCVRQTTERGTDRPTRPTIRERYILHNPVRMRVSGKLCPTVLLLVTAPGWFYGGILQNSRYFYNIHLGKQKAMSMIPALSHT